MKKVVLVFAVLILIVSNSYAQGGTAVLPFAEGKVLSSDDIGFLDLVSSAKDQKARGALTKVTFGDNSYEAGDVLSKKDAKLIEKTIKAYSEAGEDISDKEKEASEKARGCGYYCYYYYWDNYCYCYRYYYYYCCL